MRNNFCSTPQFIPVLDFDKVKETRYHGVKVDTPASVDAITVGQYASTFCFVELKGWKNYIKYRNQQKKTISETVTGYNLSGKLFDSQCLCIDICKNPDVFAHMAVCFILVTDIAPDTSGIEYIHSMLNILGETTNEVYSQCIKASQKILDSEVHIDKIYIHCKDFDKLLETI